MLNSNLYGTQKSLVDICILNYATCKFVMNCGSAVLLTYQPYVLVNELLKTLEIRVHTAYGLAETTVGD